MGARRARGRLLQQGARATRRVAEALGVAGQRLAYRPREVVVVALLAAGLFGGFAIERWRVGHPATADRLEAEPVRLASPAPIRSTARVRFRDGAARCGAPDARGQPVGWAGARPASSRLDLNRATPGELARAVGISWRLAARIVAARQAVESRAPRGTEPAGVAPPSVETPLASDTSDSEAREGTPGAEPR